MAHPIITKISKTKFPEICPVCNEEAEDLVSVTIREEKSMRQIGGYWGGPPIGIEESLMTNEKAVTFWVPTCLLHGSSSVRTARNRVITVIAFFILFYPILFMYLQINVEAEFGRPIIDEIFWLIVFVGILFSTIIYGYYPRALERAIVFENVNLIKDQVTLRLSNQEYLEQFIKMNEMVISSPE
jgi:hypothetical protein